MIVLNLKFKMCENYYSFRALSLSCKKRKAILSVEAALVVPLFLILTLMLISLTSVYYINGKIEAAVNEEAKKVAVKLYEDGYSVGAICADVESRLGSKFLSSGLILNGTNGLDFSKTDITNTEFAVVSVSYVIKLPFDVFNIAELPFEKKAIMHSYIGYLNGLNGYSLDGEYVYMAKNGTVFHKSRECSHIRLDIHNVTGKEIKVLRNDSGAKYKKCEYCHPSLSSENIYITSQGDRYHSALSCSGLRRTIIKVRISDIGSIKPCSRCGY